MPTSPLDWRSCAEASLARATGLGQRHARAATAAWRACRQDPAVAGRDRKGCFWRQTVGRERGGRKERWPVMRKDRSGVRRSSSLESCAAQRCEGLVEHLDERPLEQTNSIPDTTRLERSCRENGQGWLTGGHIWQSYGRHKWQFNGVSGYDDS